MKLRKLVTRTIVSVVGLLVLCLVLLLVIDLGVFQTRIEKIASDSLAREVKFEDGLHVHLFPTPQVRAAGVLIANPDWAAGDSFLRADKVDMEFGFWSAVKPPFQIVKLNIEGLHLDVQTQEDGGGNWPTGSGSSAADESDSGELSDILLLGNIAVSDISLTYRDHSAADEALAITGDIGLQQVSAETIKGDFAIAADGKQLTDQLAALGGGPLTAQSNFTLRTQSNETGLELSELQLAVGESDLSGQVGLSLAEAMVITAQLESRLIALIEGDEEEDAAPAEGLVFGEDTQLFDAVRDFTAEVNLDLQIGEVRTGDVTSASDVSVSVILGPGKLTIKPMQASINNGSVSGSVVMASTPDVATMALDLNAEGVRIATAPEGELDENGEPPVDLSISLTGSGRSAHAVAASANGSISIDIGSGRSTQGDVGFLANDVLAEMFSAAGPDEEELPYTDVECGIVRATIEAGKADIATILIKTSDLVITGSGDIELETESIDIGFNTKAREGLGLAAAGLVTPFVKLGGSLRSPAVAVDAPSALLAGGLAVATGGASLLGKEVLDRVVSEAADCSGQ